MSLGWSEGQLGLNKNGELSFTLLTEQDIFSQVNKQTIQWKGHDPIKLTGQLHGTHWNGERLLLTYSKTIFQSIAGENELKILQKAPPRHIFINLGGDVSAKILPTALLRDYDKGAFHRWVEGEPPIHLPVLDELQKAKTMNPWGSPNMPAIWVPRQEHFEKPVLVIFSPDLQNCQFISEQIPENFKHLGFSESDKGLWLLPEKGYEALLWNGKELITTSLPAPEIADGQWVHLSQWQGQFSHGLLKTKDGIHLKDNQGLTLIGGREKAKRENYERPLWQQTLIYLIMISSFIVILKWRQTIPPSGMPQVIQYSKASLWARGFAFMMDFFILNTPLHIISHLLGLPQIPVETVQSMLMETDPNEQLNTIVALLPIISYNVMLMVTLASIYHTLMEVFFSGSIGKLCFRLEVISSAENGIKPTWKQSIIKALLRSLDFILPIPPSFIFALIHPENKSLGDRLAKLQVVKRQ
jgi:uncharacterized RDD family membrane protein YckC